MSEPDHDPPEASRPSMPPQYGILGPTEGKGLLSWSWARERLSNARNYWISTTRLGGGPHVTPVWGVWLKERFYFSTFAASRKARNLAANPECVVCPDSADQAVIVEGVAEEVKDPAALRNFEDAYESKYQEEIDPSQGVIYAVWPLSHSPLYRTLRSFLAARPAGASGAVERVRTVVLVRVYELAPPVSAQAEGAQKLVSSVETSTLS